MAANSFIKSLLVKKYKVFVNHLDLMDIKQLID